MSELSRDARAVLRALQRFKGRPVSGEQLLERIFATTSEVPLDAERVSRAVKELEAERLAVTSGSGAPDEGFDFVAVAATRSGLDT